MGGAGEWEGETTTGVRARHFLAALFAGLFMRSNGGEREEGIPRYSLCVPGLLCAYCSLCFHPAVEKVRLRKFVSWAPNLPNAFLIPPPTH